MWPTLVGLIERWWREKPRLDVVRSVVRLRDAMQNCHRSYQEYCRAKTSTSENSHSRLRSLRWEWGRNVQALVDEVVALGTVLEIFSPELYQELSDYSYDEAWTLNDDPLDIVPNELRQEPEIEIDIDRVMMTEQFRDTLARLDTFIRVNFKPEEVYTVRSVRYR